MLNWANQFSIVLFLDSNNYQSGYGRYECVVAAGRTYIPDGDNGDLAQLYRLYIEKKDWLFGHICYDYKNDLEPALFSRKESHAGFPLFRFFIPQTVCHINAGQTEWTIESFDKPEDVFNAISAVESFQEATLPQLQFTQVTGKEMYLKTVEQLREHIRNGDCYEINYCNKGFCTGAEIDPLTVFNKLNGLSPAPFAAYYRLDNSYMMCASPERYLQKTGTRMLSQPMKGTARRDADEQQDEQLKQGLKNNIKERAENVMIVDLVRNDLARSCETGSVQVDELFGIYTYPQVHQMISTVSATLKAGVPFTDAIRYSFPMGSMTGAPKFKVMQLIEHYEQSRRELFSGSVGYITPEGDFDFNVIIRSLFYNAATRYLCYQAGGAITWDSNAEQEWQEMRLKAWALEKLFS